MANPIPDPSAIRRTGRRPPKIPLWAINLLEVISANRNLQKQAVIASALAAYATNEELDQAKEIER